MSRVDACSSAHEAVLMMRRPAELTPWEARNMRLPPAVQKLKNELLRAEQLLGTHIHSEPEEPPPHLQSTMHLRSKSASSAHRRPHTSASLFTTRSGVHDDSPGRERPGSRGMVRPRTASFPSQRRSSVLTMPLLRSRRNHMLLDDSAELGGRTDHEVKRAWQAAQTSLDNAEQNEDDAQQQTEELPAVGPPPPPLLSFPSTPGWPSGDASAQTRTAETNNGASSACPDSAASTVPMFASMPFATSQLLTVPKPRRSAKSFIVNARKQSNFRRGSNAQRHQEAKERRRLLEQQLMQKRVSATAQAKSTYVPKVHSGNLAMHWMAIVIAIQKYRVLNTYLQFLHSSHMLDDERRQQAIAVRTIECWYIVARTKNKMLERPGTTKALRTFLHHIARVQNNEKRRAGTDLIAQFLTDFQPHKNITTSMQRFRRCIVKLQRYIRGWIACQHARLQLLYLAFERELRHRRAEMMAQLKNAGRPAIVYPIPSAPSERTPVQHLSSVHERVKLLLDQAENLVHRPGAKPKPQDPKVLTASTRFIMTIDSKRLEQLRAILKNQRRRQAVADTEAYKQRNTTEARQVTTEDVKLMLAGSNDRMMEIFFERAMGVGRPRHTLFLLLISGGLEELRRVIDRELTSRAMVRGLLRTCKSPASSL